MPPPPPEPEPEPEPEPTKIEVLIWLFIWIHTESFIYGYPQYHIKLAPVEPRTDFSNPYIDVYKDGNYLVSTTPDIIGTDYQAYERVGKDICNILGIGQTEPMTYWDVGSKAIEYYNIARSVSYFYTNDGFYNGESDTEFKDLSQELNPDMFLGHKFMLYDCGDVSTPQYVKNVCKANMTVPTGGNATFDSITDSTGNRCFYYERAIYDDSNRSEWLCRKIGIYHCDMTKAEYNELVAYRSDLKGSIYKYHADSYLLQWSAWDKTTGAVVH